jgi:hypothetical protein
MTNLLICLDLRPGNRSCISIIVTSLVQTLLPQSEVSPLVIMPRTIRIALLLCDTPLPLVQRELNYPTYTPVFLSHLQDTLESYPDKKAVEGVQLEVDSFDVVGKQEYPDESKVREGWYDAVMMTGSGEHPFSFVHCCSP